MAMVYTAGLAQGLGLVTFPAASTILTSPDHFALTDTAYGALFIPQAALAVAASLLGAALYRQLGVQRVYLVGLAADLGAMLLLVASRFVMAQQGLAYGVLLVATSCMGLGFGFLVPVLNTVVAALFPRTPDKAVLALNALLGLGTALAPAFVALFVGLGIWWGLPLLVAVLLVGLLVAGRGGSSLDTAASMAAAAPATAGAHGKRHTAPTRFWPFAAFALAYGVCETLNGNWASLYMTEHFHSGTSLASLALTIFWSLVTLGRIVFASIGRWVPERLAWQVLPFVIAAAFLACALAPPSEPWLGLAGFALAGLGCSALLPLAISFGQAQLPGFSASVAGGLIAFYQVGYGLAAFGVGPVQGATGAGLGEVFGGAVLVALLAAALGLFIVRRPGAPVPGRT